MNEHESPETRVYLGKVGKEKALRCVELYQQVYGENVSPATVVNNALALLTTRLEQEFEEGNQDESVN